MEKKVSVEILGRKAWIEHVGGYRAKHFGQPRDSIGVLLLFEEAVESTGSLYVLLPVKRYTREEFIEALWREGEKELKRILKRDRKELEDRALAKKRLDLLYQKSLDDRALEKLKQDALDQTALAIRSQIGCC